MELTQYLFYFLAFCTIWTAMMVVLVKNPVHSVLFLIMTFFTITGHYVLLDAQFIAVVNIVVYAGAIMVLFLFLLMLLNLDVITLPYKGYGTLLAAVIAGGSLFVVLVGSVKSAVLTQQLVVRNADLGMVSTLGKELFSTFLLPFELVSVLLLSAMVGAILLAKKDKQTV